MQGRMPIQSKVAQSQNFNLDQILMNPNKPKHQMMAHDPKYKRYGQLPPQHQMKNPYPQNLKNIIPNYQGGVSSSQPPFNKINQGMAKNKGKKMGLGIMVDNQVINRSLDRYGYDSS